MNDWFVWNGVRSTDKGVYVMEQPPITIPEERVTFDTVRGRSGTLARLEGPHVYNDMILPARCFIRDPARVTEAAAWLRGGGEVEFASRPGGTYRARICNQIELAKVLAGNPHRSFTVNFRCQPGWLHGEPAVLDPITVSGTQIVNPGTLPSLPRILIAADGDFSLTIGQQTAFFEGVEGGILLDSRLGDALTPDGLALANDRWGGSIFEIQPGANAVSWLVEDGGAVRSVTITPRWMSL